MKNACYLKKIGMTQHINEEGLVVPVTVCSYIAQEVIRRKDLKTDGYDSLVVGVEEEKVEKQSKPKSGLFKAFKSTNDRMICVGILEVILVTSLMTRSSIEFTS